MNTVAQTRFIWNRIPGAAELDIYEAGAGKVGLQQGVIYGWREPGFHGQLDREGGCSGGEGGYLLLSGRGRWKFWRGSGYQTTQRKIAFQGDLESKSPLAGREVR